MSSCGFNLIRNARMFFTTNVNTETGVVKSDGFTITNTKEIQVLDGISFSQNTTAETVTINEAGDSPTRGQRNFNTALEPVELSFSTYMRPYFYEGAPSATAYDNNDYVEAEEDVLWNAFAAGYVNGTSELIGGATAAWKKTAGAALTEPHSDLSFAFSNKNQLQKFGVIIVLDSTSYIIDNCVLDQASIDFGIDAIATIAWTARGSAIRGVDLYATEPAAFDGTGTVTFSGNYLTGPTIVVPTTITNVSAATDSIFTKTGHGLRRGMQVTVDVTTGSSAVVGITDGVYYVISTPTADTFKLSSTLNGTSVDITTAGTSIEIDFNADTIPDVAKGKNTIAPFLANKLSVVEVLKEGISGAGTNYTLALTGGNITLSNNVTYLTPANLGVVNKPFTYFTGTRSVTGSLNCYLKTGSMNSGELLKDLIAASATNVDPAYNLQLSIGARNTSGKTRVVLHMPATVLTIPTINTEQVVSTTINFTAQGYTGTEFDICANNEISITYYSANTTP